MGDMVTTRSGGWPERVAYPGLDLLHGAGAQPLLPAADPRAVVARKILLGEAEQACLKPLMPSRAIRADQAAPATTGRCP